MLRGRVLSKDCIIVRRKLIIKVILINKNKNRSKNRNSKRNRNKRA